jgi:hypothetical protein
MMKIEFTERDEEYLAELRARGCAVTVFLPHELGAVDPEVVEERMCMAGWYAIDMLEEGTDEVDEE